MARAVGASDCSIRAARSAWGGAAGSPDIVRFGASGSTHLAITDFLVSMLARLVIFAVYYTIAVVCTRLANGGFMRFTMPAGKGRVTL